MESGPAVPDDPLAGPVHSGVTFWRLSGGTLNFSTLLERLSAGKRGFLRIFLGTAVSEFGSTLSLIALPTFAVTSLHARSSEIAAMYVVQWIPALLATIPFGKAVDCFSRLWLVIIADLVAAGAAFFASCLIMEHRMSLHWLLVVLFMGSACSTLYEIASQALIPQLLGTRTLVGGNSRLVLGQSVAKIAGQGLSARLVVVNNGILVLFLDGISFLVRAGLLFGLRGSSQQSHREVRRERASFEALRYFRARGDIVRVICSQATLNVGGGIIWGLFLVYAYRTLKLAPYHIAVMLMAGSIASVIATFFTTRMSAALGMVRTATVALLGSAASMWLILLAREVAPFFTLLAYQVGFSACGVVYQVCVLSYRQQMTPAYLQGRIASLDATLNAIATVSGLLIAALTADRLGPEVGILLGCVIASLSSIWLIGLSSTARVTAGDPNISGA